MESRFISIEALFSSEKFLDLATVTFLFYWIVSVQSWINYI